MPVVGVLEAGEDLQRRRLPAAVGAEDADPRARLDVEVDAVAGSCGRRRTCQASCGELRDDGHRASSFGCSRTYGQWRCPHCRGTGTLRHMAPAIHVGPQPPAEHLVQAVQDGGGEIAPLADAEAVVWAGSESDLGELPDGVKWVQLQSAGIEPWVERIRDTPDVQFTSAVGAYATQVAEHRAGAAARWDARHSPLRPRDVRGSPRTSACSRAARSRSSARAASGAS